MEACQALSVPGPTKTLPYDLLGADLSTVDGGATTDERPTSELLTLPPAGTLKPQLETPVPNGEISETNSTSPEGDLVHPFDDLDAIKLPSVEQTTADDSSTWTETETSTETETETGAGATPRSCIRRCRPGRRRSDTAASLHTTPVHRRGSEAPPPGPRHVHFPSSPVTALIPAADPLRLLGCGDVTTAYREACDRHGSEPIPEVIRQLEDPASDVLRLSGVEMTLADVDSLEEVMRRRRWERVDASDCALRGETLAALLQIVTHYDAAPWLSLGGAGSERLGWAAVCSAVRGAGRHSTLQWLSLDRSAPISEVAAASLGRSLRDSRLRVLHLERCNLHGRPLLTLLAAGLRAATGLRQLYLGDNELGSGDGSLLGAALRQNTSLQLLDLRNNALDDDSAGYLLTCLSEQKPTPSHTGLLTLNLWNNRLTGESAAHLAILLSAHPALETLNLGANPLGDGAARSLAEPLARSGPLRRLGLQRCRLGDEAAAVLGCVLAAASGLVRLDLRRNRLSATGLSALLEGVKENVTLRQLDLDTEEPVPEMAQEPAPESGTDAVLDAVPESGHESSPETDSGGEGRDSPERADSGIDSPAKFVNSSRDCGGEAGSLESSDGAALGTSADSTLGSSPGDPDSPAFRTRPPCSPNDRVPCSPEDQESGEGAESVGVDSDSDSSPGGRYRSLLSALAAVCETNRRRPVPEVASPPTPLPEAEDEPSTGQWLRRRLSAALRRVSLTCETPPRLPAAATAPVAAAATAVAAPATAPANSTTTGVTSAAQPVPVPKNRRLVSPSPSPSESPLPSPTSGRSRFRVFRVSSVEPSPGTPPLTRGLPRPSSAESERAVSPSLSRDGSPRPVREESSVSFEEDVSGPMRKDSIAVLRQRSCRSHGDGRDSPDRCAGDGGDSLAGSLGATPCEDKINQWQADAPVNPSEQWASGDSSLSVHTWPRTQTPTISPAWTPTASSSHGSSTLSPDSGLGEAGRLGGGGAGGSSGQCWRSVPRTSPRAAGRRFRVTPVRETLGPA